MLKKSHRLTRPVFQGKTINSPLFVLKSLASGNEKTRIGFVVSKKIDKRANVRNRLKRLFSEAAKDVLDRKGRDLTFFIKKSAIGAPLNDVKKEVARVKNNI